jgi:aryl-alcohol dehydrogenase-like predicted oxidoreductase
MKYRRLGRTNLQVSEISLGTVELGQEYGIPTNGHPLRPTEAESVHLLNWALEMGVNFIDTARAYGDSEAIIGRGLKKRRREFILASKVNSQEGLTGRGLRQQVKASIAGSLRALQTEVIDLMYIHNATLEVIKRREVLEVLQDAQRAGHIRFIGASTYGDQSALAALDDGGYDCLQVAYNLLDRQAEQRILPIAQENDVGIVARSVLLKGAFSQRYVRLPNELKELKAAVGRLETICGIEKLGLPETAYRFVLANPKITSALVGTGWLNELKEVLGFADKGPLHSALEERVRQITMSDPEQLNPTTWPPIE